MARYTLCDADFKDLLTLPLPLKPSCTNPTQGHATYEYKDNVIILRCPDQSFCLQQLEG